MFLFLIVFRILYNKTQNSVNRFLTKLLTEDLPRLFVRPKKILLDFQKGKSIGPIPNDFQTEEQEGNKEYVGELSVTLVDARKLSYLISGNSSTSYPILDIHTACEKILFYFQHTKVPTVLCLLWCCTSCKSCKFLPVASTTKCRNI